MGWIVPRALPWFPIWLAKVRGWNTRYRRHRRHRRHWDLHEFHHSFCTAVSLCEPGGGSSPAVDIPSLLAEEVPGIRSGRSGRSVRSGRSGQSGQSGVAKSPLRQGSNLCVMLTARAKGLEEPEEGAKRLPSLAECSHLGPPPLHHYINDITTQPRAQARAFVSVFKVLYIPCMKALGTAAGGLGGFRLTRPSRAAGALSGGLGVPTKQSKSKAKVF